MKTFVFRPKYSLKNFLDVIALDLLLIFTLVFSYLKNSFSLTSGFGWIFLGFLVVWVLHFLVRRIAFSQSTIYVERYTWPSKTFEYSDMIDIGKIRIRTQKGDVSFIGMINAHELLSRFTEITEQGKINKGQIENKVVIQEILFRKSIVPTMIISAVIWSAIFYFWPLYHSRFGSIV